MSYIPNTKTEQRLMLDAIGADSIADLFHEIPRNLRLKNELKLPAPMSEYELSTHMKSLFAENISADSHACFMGGGIYDHYIPSAVNHIAGRQEFYTAYTPYQAEMSQGTLQVMFEFQTFMTMLTGTDVSNASVYDGATACAEAMLMAQSVNKKSEVILSCALNAEYIKTCQTYAKFRNLCIRQIDFDLDSGSVCTDSLASLINENTSSIMIQSPNFFGIIENLEEISQIAKQNGIILIVVSNPISLGLLKPPGHLGADIVVGEGQSLGNPMSFGGPGFGYFTCKSEYLRKMPGRIVGETTDKDGNRGFVLTMQAREQHIRREKATSNICSNQALNTLRATVYLSLLGREGFRKMSATCCKKAHYMHDALINTGCFEKRFNAPFFNEFVLRYKGCLSSLMKEMTDAGILPGIDISALPGLENCVLIAVTEKRMTAQIDDYVKKAVKCCERQ